MRTERAARRSVDRNAAWCVLQHLHLCFRMKEIESRINRCNATNCGNRRPTSVVQDSRSNLGHPNRVRQTLKAVAAFVGSIVSFAVLVVVWPEPKAQSRLEFWDSVLVWLPWLFSFVLWALGTYQWVTRESGAKWVAVLGSIVVLVAIFVVDICVAVTVSCFQGNCI